jgi:glycosyltransferase involved in cell wall biosynthesis
VKLSAVMPCLDAQATIATQLDALSRQRWQPGWELVIADNGSNDATRAIVDRYGDRLPLRVVDASGRRGDGHARNVGAAAAGGSVLVFCDADDEVGDGWLEAIARALGEHEVVASLAETGKLNEPWARAARDENPEGLPRLPFPPHLPFGSTYGLGVRREVHERVGGFDESLAALADVDYTIRLQLAGATIGFEPAAVVHYRQRDTLGGIHRQARMYARDFACLQKRYADGPVGRSWTWPARGWLGLLRALPEVRDRAGRARLAWLAGWQLGRIEGSVRYGVLAV